MSPRKKFAIVLGALALLLLTFAAGRYSRPARVETKEHTVYQDKIVEKIVNHDVVRTEVIHDQVVAKNVETKIVWEKAPDGGIKTTETITDLTKTSTETNTNRTHENVTQTDLTQVVRIDSTKNTITTFAAPSWSIALMPGLDVRGLVSDGLGALSGSTLAKRGILAASVDRRIVGTLFAGVWGNTAGAGGLTVRLEF